MRAAAQAKRLAIAATGFSEGLRGPLSIRPGTYLLFNQVTRLHIRGNDLHLILERLFDNREELRRLDLEGGRVPAPVGEQPTVGAAVRLEHTIRLDFEALYVFGNAALDLWAAVTGYVLGRSEALSFDNIRIFVAEPSKTPREWRFLLERLASDILWLAAVVRFYRNRFIVHVKRPWQISQGRTVSGYDFNLWSPLGDNPSSSDFANQVRAVAGKAGLSLPLSHTPHQLLFQLLMEIGRIPDRSVRRHILDLYERHGSATPSFHVVGDRLLQFLAQATEVTLDAALDDPDRVVLGRV